MLVPLNAEGERVFEDFWQLLREGQQQPRDKYPILGPKNAEGQYEMPFYLFVRVFGGVACWTASDLKSILTGALHLKV